MIDLMSTIAPAGVVVVETREDLVERLYPVAMENPPGLKESSVR